MNKGFAEEILSFILIIFSVIILTVFFASEDVLKGGEVSRSVRGRMMDESANLAIQTLCDNKLEKFNKTYMELILDSQLQGGNGTHVYYGQGLGTVYTTEVIVPLMNNYFGDGGWELVIKTTKGTISYGSLKEESKYNYVSNIPVPPSVSEDNTGNVTLYV
ncbi:MAG: hypothetical protein ABEK36_06275 [Candidatus Aenigmatarchaeota archaeon]